MDVVVVGGTGFIGQPLCRLLSDAGHAVTVLTRDAKRAAERLPANMRAVEWRADQPGEWEEAVARCDAAINLAGVSIGGQRWTPEYKQRIRDSRILPTRALVAVMSRSPRPGRVLLSASGIGFYGDTGDRIVDEQSSPGHDFLAQLSVDWEGEARKAEEAGVRVVLLRTGLVLGRGGGVLGAMEPIFRRGVGGPLGSGRQWVSWIHIDDETGMIRWAMENPQVAGPMNLVTPHPVTMREFAASLGRALHRPAIFPVPAFMLKLVVGEFAESMLTGQRAMPTLAQQLGYRWKYPTLDEALRAIFTK